MAQRLSGKQIAILATHGFEQSELTEPKRLLEAEGARVSVVSPAKEATIKGWNDKDWGGVVAVDLPLDEADAGRFDAVVLPGGVINPDTLRTDEAALGFIRSVAEAGKPVAAICHGPWLLINSGLADGRELTSWPSLQQDLANAGAKWRNAEVVVDGNVITSRKPDDIPAFSEAVVKALVA
ncbi:type 1 glutamine amidotransferase [Stenotrophomonas maltophilia]|uniref:type 1 glutamine amidotransferase domain-containing protein n=1 Tax=Stenotrophomonas maltophilia group TaxID=995085 RepID=UPI0015DFBF34|nr:type 1 glutamine amidotransferase domain-containing protein [Stenotrophomonas maltophilia]MBA0436550.1 type 1 glutamine amidotransferase [Stenotrophomonas maltophilia]MDZ5813440.1 type 1 glutamine amidotransferase domain-containing protein [Stenotrophomonas maltophilia]